MSARVRDDDHRPDELLEEHGRIASRLGLAVAWTSGIRSDTAKRAADGGSGAGKRAAPLPDSSSAAALFKTRCRTRNPVCAAGASGLVLVEVDGDDSLAAERGIALPGTVTARSRRGLHRYYLPAEGCWPAKFQIAPDGITLVEDGYLVMPPALHPVEGVTYEWVEADNIVELPADTYWDLVRLHGETEGKSTPR